MGRIALITGAAGGIGRTVLERLRADDWAVIGTDLRQSDIDADLAVPQERAGLIEQVRRRASTGLDLIVTCGGVSGSAPPRIVVSLNYFGTVALLEGLRPLLAMREAAHAVAISSTAAMQPGDDACIEACLAGDETGALARAEGLDEEASYVSSKRAVALWVRREATAEKWAGRGISLNSVAPGVVKTAMVEPFLGTSEGMAMMRRITPIATRDYAAPWVLAEAITGLAGLRGGYLIGQVLYVDGGADALRRPDQI